MNTTTQRIAYVFGISMAVLMAVSLIFPAIISNQTTTVEVEPTNTAPPPTFPPPLTDFSSISFNEQDYLHPSGVVAVSVPTGWEVVPPGPAGPTGGVNLNLNSESNDSTIQVSVEAPPQELTTTESISAYLPAARLEGAWAGTRFLGGVDELRRDIEGDRLLVEFALQDSQQREFFARQASWTDGDWLYSVRVAVPENAVDLLDFLLDPMIDAVKPQRQFQDTPLTWTAYFDEEVNHILRYPTGWTQTDGGAGVPTSFSTPTGLQVQVASSEETIESEEAALAWVEGVRGGIDAEEAQPVERSGGSGYAVTYTYTNPDGEIRDGYAVLLNGEEGLLHTAVALLPIGEEISPFGAVEATEEPEATPDPNLPPGIQQATPFGDAVEALNTFSLILDLNLPEPEAEATPEATAPVEEATESAESTPAPEATESAEVTEDAPEATEEAEATEED